ncbi:MAG TPA: hypothetical protein VD994_09490 [Prosthecobacter sp.]|nr:hypothetical protein [Prosthecobacter sp.]
MTTECLYAPLHRWLVLLCQGWTLPWIVEPMEHHGHGERSVLMTRPA